MLIRGTYLLLTIIVLSVNCYGQFGTPKTIEAQSLAGVWKIESGDFDNDGDEDLVAASFAHKLAVFENLGNGAFSEQQTIHDGFKEIQDFDVHDINLDGSPDIIAGDKRGQLFWFPNLNGEFPIRNDLSGPNTGDDWWVTSIVFADVDMDGLEDIVAFNRGVTTTYWYKRLSNTTFSTIQQLNELDWGVRVARDLDGDGDIDFISSLERPPYQIGWYENDGTGGYLYHRVNNTEEVKQFHDEDLDGDGDVDIIASFFMPEDNQQEFIGWYENDGNGNFGSLFQIDDSLSWLGVVRVADLDDDGDMDILTGAAHENELHWFENDGLQNFTDAQLVSNATKGIEDIRVRDYDNNGSLDIMIASSDESRVIFLPNDGNENFTIRTFLTNANWPASICAADWDGDDDNDLLVADWQNDEIIWYENRGNGNFNSKVTLLQINKPGYVASKDLNGDMRSDLIYAYDLNNLQSLENPDATLAWRPNDNGLPGAEQSITNDAFEFVANSFNGDWISIDPIQDYDGDGDIDIMLEVYIDSSVLSYFKNNGTGQFASQSITSQSQALSYTPVALEDMDSDGNKDLVILHQEIVPPYDNGIAWMRNTGMDQFDDPIFLQGTENDDLASYYVGDLNGDDIPDIIGAPVFTGPDLAWYENDGNAQVTFHTYGPGLDYDEQPRLVYDFNDDGARDILTTTISNYAIHWYESNGDNEAESGSVVATPYYDTYDYVLTADLDNDNDPDILYTTTEYDIGWIPSLLGQDQVRGRVYVDFIPDCVSDTIEDPVWPAVVVAESDDHFVYDMTNRQGEYRLFLPEDGQYIIRTELPNQYFSHTCFIDSTVEITDTSKFTIDIPLNVDFYCPLNEVSISVNFLRPCFDSEYTVHYCNSGTAPSEDTYITIDLDSFMTLTGSTVPIDIDDLDSLRLTADLGNIAAGECGSFRFNVFIDCSTQLDQVQCVEAQIYPGGACHYPAAAVEGWDSSSIEVEAECIGDSVEFRIRNIGSGDSDEPLEYKVIEDNVIFREGQFQLNSQEELIFWEFADGVTYILVAEQSQGHPGNSNPTAFIQGCNGIFTPGILDQFVVDDGDEYIDILCRTVTGSFDPNDKQPDVTGYGVQHYIEANTNIEYTIRFQNTGTDTAFSVSITDTLSEYLNPVSIVSGASSHPYEMDLDGAGILVIDFPGIELPDSNVDFEGSNGFVKFIIDQDADHPDGTVIENNAAIYFDFNKAVVTNTVFHTIGSDFIERDIRVSVLDEMSDVPVSAYPNPATSSVLISIDTPLSYSNVNVSLFNISGTMISSARMDVSNNSFYLDIGHLLPGIYFATLTNEDGNSLRTVKIILGN